jgi:uncharacterized protein Yka (UPF0111/DUF47 family)
MIDLSSLTIPELQELISEIDKLLPHKQEDEWVKQVKALEDEALEIVEELRTRTGRDYQLTLHNYPIGRKKWKKKHL